MLSKPWKAEKWVFDFISRQWGGIRDSRDLPLRRIIEPLSHFTQNFTFGLFPQWNINLEIFYFNPSHSIFYTVKFLFFLVGFLRQFRVLGISQTDFWNFSPRGFSLWWSDHFLAENSNFDHLRRLFLRVRTKSSEQLTIMMLRWVAMVLNHRWNREAMVEGGMAKPCSMPGSREGGMPKGRGIRGADANRSRSTSDSWRRFVFARRFWNQIFTWKCQHFNLYHRFPRRMKK